MKVKHRVCVLEVCQQQKQPYSSPNSSHYYYFTLNDGGSYGPFYIKQIQPSRIRSKVIPYHQTKPNSIDQSHRELSRTHTTNHHHITHITITTIIVMGGNMVQLASTNSAMPLSEENLNPSQQRLHEGSIFSPYQTKRVQHHARAYAISLTARTHQPTKARYNTSPVTHVFTYLTQLLVKVWDASCDQHQNSHISLAPPNIADRCHSSPSSAAPRTIIKL